MRRKRAVTVLEWEPEPCRVAEDPIELTCECGADLTMPVALGTRVLATKGMGIFFDTTEQPPNATPDVIQCPACHREYGRDTSYRFETRKADK